MTRNIIQIDESKCNGCGDCIPGCPEGALQIVEGKARLTAEVMCDGLGACLGRCPQGAITIIDKEAAPYDERQVMKKIIQDGPEAITAHLAHLRDHKDHEHLSQALEVLAQTKTATPKAPLLAGLPPTAAGSGCPGSRAQWLGRPSRGASASSPSALTHWPIQLHLINPSAPQYLGAEVLLAADCTAFATGSFHSTFLPGKSLIIACPKLDQDQERYRAKLAALIEQAGIKTLTVMIMEVPCCGGLFAMAQAACRQATRPVPLKRIILSLAGEVLDDSWVTSPLNAKHLHPAGQTHDS
jgi:ferredoxin